MSLDLPRPRQLPKTEALRVARELAAEQDQVVSRWQLSQLGVPRWIVQRELSVGRWQQVGAQTLVLHNGPIAAASLPWIAVSEAGRRAALDGLSALLAAGVTGLTSDEIHVIAPKSSTPVEIDGVRVHESRRFREEDVLTNGIRRTRPQVATIHAALWAKSDRQAKLFVIVAVQQRLTTAPWLREALADVQRDRRRPMLRRLILEVAGGIQSLGELDIAEDFRQRRLPEPARQVVRKRRSGREYLDCDLPAYALSLEIDGVGHDAPEQRLDDLVRDIATATEGKSAIRISLVAYALDKDRVLDALEELLTSRGWTRDEAA